MGLSMKMSLTVTWNMEEIVLYSALSFGIIDSVDLEDLWQHIQSIPWATWTLGLAQD